MLSSKLARYYQLLADPNAQVPLYAFQALCYIAYHSFKVELFALQVKYLYQPIMKEVATGFQHAPLRLQPQQKALPYQASREIRATKLTPTYTYRKVLIKVTLSRQRQAYMLYYAIVGDSHFVKLGQHLDQHQHFCYQID